MWGVRFCSAMGGGIYPPPTRWQRAAEDRLTVSADRQRMTKDFETPDHPNGMEAELAVRKAGRAASTEADGLATASPRSTSTSARRATCSSARACSSVAGSERSLAYPRPAPNSSTAGSG